MAKFTGHTITSDSALGSAVIQRSLRFNRGDSPYLQTTLGNGNVDKWTWSGWVKKTINEQHQNIFSSGSDNVVTMINFDNNDYLKVQNWHSAQKGTKITNRKFRDLTGWLHIVVIWDSGNSTADDRIRLYVNGTRETSFSSSSNPDQNQDSVINGNTLGGSDYGEGKHFIGKFADVTDPSGTYKTEIHFIDGYAYDPSYFGFTDPVTGIWMPKRYEGVYGSNGFYLDFSDNTSTTTLGIDKSPNGNDFTLNNLATGDSVLDTPSNNFSTLRYYTGPASSGSSLSEGNLKFITGSSGSARNLNRMGISTFLPTSGKWYVEVRALDSNGQNFIGVGSYQVEILQTANNTRYAFVYTDGDKYVRTAGSESIATYAASYTQNDIIGIYVDMDASTPLVSFSKNGQWANGSGSWNQSTPTSYITLGDTFFTESTGGHSGIGFIVSSGSGGTSATYQFNFGQDSTFSGLTTAGGNKDDRGIGDFKYPVPSGALALCSVNLPLTAPSIVRPQKHFGALLYTGNGSSGHRISGLEFKPDFAWVKRRDSGANHGIYDSVTGVTSYLRADLNNAQDTNLSHLSSFNEDGFTLGADTYQNGNSQTFVAWCWKGGGTAVSNSDGSITSSVSANQEAGFSIVTWTGSGADASIGHGLGKKPKVLFVKNRSASDNWKVWFKGVTTDDSYSFQLDTSGANYSGSDKWYNQPNGNDTTTTTFGVSDDGATNRSGELFVSYCWAEIPGYSKFGTYRGNGQSEGKFVDCGFRPAFLIIKRVNAARNWMIFDNKRDPDNPVQTFLEADQSSADATLNGGVDFLSNGFKCITSDTDVNANDTSGGDTYIYMAYAEQPGETSFDTFPNAR